MATIEKRTSQDGTVSYRVKVRLKGCRPASETFARLTDAKRWAQDTEVAMRDGRHFKTAEAKRHTLADTIDRYIKEVLPSKPGSARSQKPQLLVWKARIGPLTLADVTRAVIAKERDRLLDENIGTAKKPRLRAPATVNRHLAVLSHVFSVSMNDWEWVEDNPVRKIRKSPEPRGRVRVLSDTERTTLLAACQDSKNKALYPIGVIAISTGMRLGEILTLCKGQVDLEKGRIVLHHTKNGERRVVPLTGRALELLTPRVKGLSSDSALLFPGADPAKPIVIKTAWQNALKRAGIDNFRFHDLRHCAASYLLEAGASLGQLAEVLGHKTLQMVKRYSHLSAPESTRIVGEMNARIFGGA